MHEDTLLPFLLSSVQRKKVTAAFDGGRMTSDGGVMLLATIETRLGIAARLAPLLADPRNPAFVTHNVAYILRARMLAIACGYEDGDDLDHLRSDPGFELACGRLPDSGRNLCSQPTVSRWENAPTLREVRRLTDAMVDIYRASYPRPPRAVTPLLDAVCPWNLESFARCFAGQRAGRTLGGEHAGPFVERQVAGHDRRAALVSLAEHLKLQFGAGLRQRHVAEFVDHRQLVAGKLAL